MKKDSSSESNIIYNQQCSILNMAAVPYIGVYSQHYTFMHPVSVIRKNSIKDNTSNFPEKMREAISELQNHINMQSQEYFIIHLDGTYLHDKYIKTHHDQLLRLNLVFHPYIYSDMVQIKKDYKTSLIPSIFRAEKDDPIYLSNSEVIMK